MSAASSRKFEIWTSSLAHDLDAINGAFGFHLTPSLMVSQMVEFLYEIRGQNVEKGDLINPFIQGMISFDKANPTNLFWRKSFSNPAELYSFDLSILWRASRELEIHTDINLTYSQVTYMADVGTGPNLPLMVISRLPIRRGVAFELEERAAVAESLA